METRAALIGRDLKAVDEEDVGVFFRVENLQHEPDRIFIRKRLFIITTNAS